MALFGTDMVNVVTPDGRRLTMPAQLAQGFPGLSITPPPAAPPPLPVAPPPPEFTPQDLASLAPKPETAANQPVTAPSQVAPTGEPQAPRGPVQSPAQAADAGPANTPAPMTNDKLAKIGTAGAYNEEQKALEGERSATRRQGEALADQATAVGNQMAAADEHAQQLLLERQRFAEENAKALQAKQDEYMRNAKAIADTKIDRSADHPVFAALSAALVGIGQALNGQPINAMEPVYKAIDRKVAGQMADLERRRAGLGLQKEALGMQREAGRDRLAEMDTYRLAYIEQARRQVETVKQKTTSDIVRANADVALAQLDEKAATTLGSAVQREQQKREAEAARAQTLQMHRESIGVQIRGQNLQNQQFQAQLEETRQQKAAEIAEKLLAAGQKEKAERAKQLSETGVLDPSTSDFMLTPAGQDKMKEADRLESVARATQDPAQAQKINSQAAALRESAKLNDVATALNHKGQERAQTAADGAQKASNSIDSARKLLQTDPSAFKREDWAQIRVDIENVKALFATHLGERLSVRALEAFDEVLSIDPDSITSRTLDKGKAIAALGALEREINSQTDVVLKGAGIKSGWRPAKRTNEEGIKGETAKEVGESATPGVVSRGLARAMYPISGAEDKIAEPQKTAEEYAAGRTNARGQSSNYGLDPKDDDRVRGLIARAGSAGNAEYSRIIDSLAQPLVSGRESLSIGVAKLLRDEDPKLYAEVMGRVAAGSGAEKAKELDETVRMADQLKIQPPPSLGKLSPTDTEKWRKKVQGY